MKATTLTPQQEESLNNSLGGSSIPDLFGVGYGSPLTVYNNIIHPESRPDLSDNPHVLAGIYLEPVIRKMTIEILGLKVQQCNITKYDPVLPFAHGNIDSKVVGRKEGMEFKNRIHFQGDKYGDEGTDQILDSELMQCLWYLMITGWERWHLVVLIGGYDLRHFVVERNEETEALIQQIRTRAIQFWRENIEKRVPPEPINKADLKALYPVDNGAEIAATTGIHGTLIELKLLKQSIANMKAESEALELEVKSFMGDNAFLVDDNAKTLCSWKKQNACRVDTKLLKKEQPDIVEQYSKLTTSRVLRLK